MKIKRLFLIPLVVGLGLATVLIFAASGGLQPARAAAGTTYYATTSGADSNGCTNNTIDACYTVNRALEGVSAGDVISVTGTITDAFTVDGNSLTNIIIQGAGSQNTIIQANAVYDTASSWVMTITNSAAVTISGVTVRHGKDSVGSGIYVLPAL